MHNKNKQAGFAIGHALVAIGLLVGVTVAGRYVLDSHRTNTKIVQLNETSGLLVQAASMLIAESSDSDGDGFREAPAFTADPAAPAGGGIVPATSGAPKTDGKGRSLGYCTWDHGTTNSSAGRLNGDNPGTVASISVAVLSSGDNGVFEMSCGDAALNNRLGDDKSVRYTAGQASQGVLSNAHWGTPVLDAAERDALDSGALQNGEIRLVESENKLYRWDASGGVWAEVAQNLWTDEGGWISYSDALSGALVASGTAGTGSTPVSGAGTRMMWLPHKSAFRAGAVTGTQWNEANVGNYSAAFGDDSIASGSRSFAAGEVAESTGLAGVSLGKQVLASGGVSTAIGEKLTASANNSMVFGRGFDNTNRLVNSVSDSLMIGFMSSALDTVPEFFVRDGGIVVNGSTVVESLTNNGRLALAETTAPAATAGYGKLYVNSADSKLYFLNDSGVALSLSDAVTGSGTAGYLPKFTGSAAVGDSLIYDDGTNIGIGTTTPTSKLHIVTATGNNIVRVDTNDATVGRYAQFSARTTNGGAAFGAVEGGSAAASYGFVGTNTASPFVFRINAAEVARFDTDGDLGIGTTTPLAKLHVDAGQILATGTYNAAASGFVPVSGTGTRMMWIPERAAFRAGYAIDDDWDEARIGSYSAAFGRSNRVGGDASFSAGDSNDVSGSQSAAFGYNVTVSGGRSFGAGVGSVASGSTSFAVGREVTAAGDYSFMFGYGWDTVNRMTNNTASSFAVGYMSAAGDTTPEFVVSDNSVVVNGRTQLNGQAHITGSYTATGTPIVTGAGSRFSYLPSLGALRAGRVTDTRWDTISPYSVALGYNSNASNNAAFAMGEAASATGASSVSLGSYTVAGGLYSMALGRATETTNNRAFVFGKGFDTTNKLVNSTTDSLMIGFMNAAGDTTPEMFIRDGAVVINGTAPQAGYFLTVYGSAYASGGTWTPSDSRYKKNITDITGALELVKMARPVRYEYRASEFKDKGFDSDSHIGFIAQELKELFPELVKEDAAGFLAVDYGALTPVLAGAIQEQQVQIETIDERLKLAERGVEIIDNPFSNNPDDKIELGSVKTDEQVLMERGTAQLKGGVARIELPKLFKAITHSHSISAHLTPEHDAKGRAALTYEYDNGVLVVRDESGANPAQRFSWQVMAERKDTPKLRTEVKMADFYKVPEW